jgi:histidinol-phosphatase (PHP family)
MKGAQKMRSDFHLHSHYSGDCQVPMDQMIETAIQLGIDRLCFTEHHDLDYYPHSSIDFTLDIESYIQGLSENKLRFQNQIELLCGIELGMQPHLHSTLDLLVNSHEFDFVLASNHLANRIDVYEKIYFETRSQYKGYLDYLEDILSNVKGFQNYDVYAHLDYVIRYGDFENKKMLYKDFTEVLDAILKQLIIDGKGIEVNTSGYRYNLGEPHPSREILKHYKSLGGEIITIGSDAHQTRHLMNHFDDAHQLLREVGFNYFTTFVKRVPQFHLL